jgi:hypothetical protein
VRFRCGSGGEVRVLRDRLQPHNVLDWAAGPVNGHRGPERERVGRNGVVAYASGCVPGRLLFRPLSHHCRRFSHLHPGPSLAIFIFIGTLIFCMGSLEFSFSKLLKKKNQLALLLSLFFLPVSNLSAVVRKSQIFIFLISYQLILILFPAIPLVGQ